MNQNRLVKLAPAPGPAMTVAPPVLNFSQTFLSPYIHELNFVQLPPNFTKYVTHPTPSNMILPVSVPKQHGDKSSEGEIKTRLPETLPATCNDANIKTMENKDRSEENFKINPPIFYKNQQMDCKSEKASFSLDKGTYKERQYRNSVVKAVDGAITANSIDSFVEEEDGDSDGDLTSKGENMGRTSAEYSYTLGECDNAVDSVISVDKNNRDLVPHGVEERWGLAKSNDLFLSHDQVLRPGKSHSSRDIGLFNENNSILKQIFDDLKSSDNRQGDINRNNGFHIAEDVDNQEHILRGSNLSELGIKHAKGDTFTNEHNFGDNTREVLSHSRKRKAFRPQRVVHDKIFLKDVDT